MTRKMATISPLLFQTPSVSKLLVAASGSGNKFPSLLLSPILILLFFSAHTSRTRFIRANGSPK